jgi:pilus assembly protein Flp/PilA
LNQIRKLASDKRGAGLTEYIMLVGLIALFAIGAFKIFGSTVSGKINNQAGTVGNIQDTAGP